MVAGARVEFVVAGIMIGWLLLSALCQIPCSLTRWIRAFDLAGLIPVWPFFAPVPGTCDYYLLYRDKLPDGSLSDWREILLCDDRRYWQLIWNPRKREKKALFDLTAALMAEARPDAIQAIQLSVPYLAILTFVSSLPRRYPACATQFLLMMTDETSIGVVPEPIFTSAVHSL
jgi:hypothetical protein